MKDIIIKYAMCKMFRDSLYKTIENLTEDYNAEISKFEPKVTREAVALHNQIETLRDILKASEDSSHIVGEYIYLPLDIVKIINKHGG